MNWSSPLRVLATVLVALALCNSARADPEVGWWWNPDESGRGFFIESQGGIVFLAGYFYESGGRATWLVAGGANSDPYSYDGRLLHVTGGQTLFGDYQPPASPTDAGPVSLRFTDDQHGTLTWPGGTIAIERDYFGAPGDTETFQPESGWWWNAAESGRGYSIEVQGNVLFAVAFMYDDAGNPVWYWSAGPLSTPTHYDGQWLQFANGQTLGGPYKPPTSPVQVGRLIIDFTSVGEAVVTSTDSIAAAKVHVTANRSRTTPVAREFNYPNPVNPPQGFAGNFSLTVLEKTADEVETISDRIDVTADLSFVLDPVNHYSGLFPNEGAGSYLIQRSGSTPLHFHWEHTSSTVYGETCEGVGYDETLSISDGNTRGFLAVGTTSGRYRGSLSFGSVALTQMITCTIPGTMPEQKAAFVVVPVQFGIRGVIRDDYVRKHSEFQFTPADKIRLDYSFRATR
jgi:hypothetical protein